MSQARNVVYNVANIIPKTIVDILSMPTSKAFELLGLHKEQRKLSLAAYLYAMRKFGAGTVEAIEQVITGREKRYVGVENEQRVYAYPIAHACHVNRPARRTDYARRVQSTR